MTDKELLRDIYKTIAPILEKGSALSGTRDTKNPTKDDRDTIYMVGIQNGQYYLAQKIITIMDGRSR